MVGIVSHADGGNKVGGIVIVSIAEILVIFAQCLECFFRTGLAIIGKSLEGEFAALDTLGVANRIDSFAVNNIMSGNDVLNARNLSLIQI